MEKKIIWYLEPKEKHLWKNLFMYLNGKAEVADKSVKKIPNGSTIEVIELEGKYIQYIISDGDMFRSYHIYFNQDGGNDIEPISVKDASALLKGGEPSTPKAGKVFEQRASLAYAKQILNLARSKVSQARGTKKKTLNITPLKEKYDKEKITLVDLKGQDKVVAQVLGIEFSIMINVPKLKPYLAVSL
jgi:hypothetical protein